MNKHQAREALSEAVAIAIMVAERRGLSTTEIAEIVNGEITIRPGYPEAFVPSTKFKLWFWDQFDPSSADYSNARYTSEGEAKRDAEQAWHETAELGEDKSASPIFWEGRIGRCTYHHPQAGQMKCEFRISPA